MRLDLVGRAAGAVECFVEPVGDVFAGLDALALDERGPCLLVFVVAADEVEHALGRRDGDHALVILDEGEQFAAVHTGVEAAAAIFTPLRAITLPCSVRSRMAYTAHWPVY